jgi:hypothetical protein
MFLSQVADRSSRLRSDEDEDCRGRCPIHPEEQNSEDLQTEDHQYISVDSSAAEILLLTSTGALLDWTYP